MSGPGARLQKGTMELHHGRRPIPARSRAREQMPAEAAAAARRMRPPPLSGRYYGRNARGALALRMEYALTAMWGHRSERWLWTADGRPNAAGVQLVSAYPRFRRSSRLDWFLPTSWVCLGAWRCHWTACSAARGPQPRGRPDELRHKHPPRPVAAGPRTHHDGVSRVGSSMGMPVRGTM